MCEVRLEGQRFDEDACRSQRRIEIFVGQVSLKERHFQGGGAHQSELWIRSLKGVLVSNTCR